MLEEQLGSECVLLTPSCTQALEMAALLLDVGPGDEVISPSFTFPSTVGAFVLRGARPVFAEIRTDTLNLDEGALEGLITERTKAIVCTHYAGVGCEMEPLLGVAERHGVELVEDNAQGLFGAYRGKPLGTFGRFGALSFHETKNVTCGEGGALLLRDRADVERAEVLREKGTNRSAFFRGEVDSYHWVDVGSSYLVSELQAAFLCAQLEARERIQTGRRRIWLRYERELRDWAERHGVRLPVVPQDRDQPWHLFYLLLPGRRERDSLIAELRSRGILSVFHYLPLHLSPMARRLGASASLPVTEDVAARVVRLPLFAGLGEAEQTEVVTAVTEFQP
jgi:dTDP-4-amino-4,6-dideoxygalactose transaminase